MQINDQIFQIGDINVRNMSSEQVASVLRQSSVQGQFVKFIVARPVHNSLAAADAESSVVVAESSPTASSIWNESSVKILRDNLSKNKALTICSMASDKRRSFFVRTADIADKRLNIQDILDSKQGDIDSGIAGIHINNHTLTTANSNISNNAAPPPQEQAELSPPAPPPPPPPDTTTTTTSAPHVQVPIDIRKEESVEAIQEAKEEEKVSTKTTTAEREVEREEEEEEEKSVVEKKVVVEKEDNK